jgi:ribosomal protein S18 acetylase RimI-like enzyme
LTAINQLLREQFYSHIHSDWFSVEHWVDHTGFVVLEDGAIQGSIAATAAPPPAAWVRLAVLRYGRHAATHLQTMLNFIFEHLTQEGISELAWMSNKRWADQWLPALGFSKEYWIEAYAKENLDLPPHQKPPNLHIRPILPEDFSPLVELEKETYAPLWRHSYKGLHLAWHQALSFDVALMNGRIVGFQHSVPAENNTAHLARMTVHPTMHGLGIGSALLAHTIQGYQNRGFTAASLNTQTDNQASQKLYKRFGFESINYKLPVWVRQL